MQPAYQFAPLNLLNKIYLLIVDSVLLRVSYVLLREREAVSRSLVSKDLLSLNSSPAEIFTEPLFEAEQGMVPVVLKRYEQSRSPNN
mgnify:CR=1 FL=1